MPAEQEIINQITQRILTNLPNKTMTHTVQQYSCSVCKDALWINTTDNNFKACECQQALVKKRIRESSGIDLDDASKSFDSFKESKDKSINMAKISAVNYLKTFLKTEKERCNSICFLGKIENEKKLGVGTGKTHLAIAIANGLVAEGIEVKFFSYRENITAIKQSSIDPENYTREMSKFKNARVLFIDDLFKGKITDADINIMFEIINYRYLEKKAMIITSELNLKALDIIDQAIASRCYEMAQKNVNIMGGERCNYRYHHGN